MRCPFHCKHRAYFSTIVSGDYADFIEEMEQRACEEYEQKYPRCWDKFLHWLGVK